MRCAPRAFLSALIAVALAVPAAAAGRSLMSAAPAPASAPSGWAAPAFCRGLACPKFTVLQDKVGGNDNIQLRRYDPSTWVSTEKKAATMGEAMTPSFMKLFNFISGSNAASQTIAMTAPVLTKVQPGQGPTCGSSFTTSFFLDGSAKPKPTDPAAYIDDKPAMEVYVLSFPGFAEGKDYAARAAELSSKLKAAGLPHADGYWYAAGYNSPYQLNDRHNEVWVPAGNGGAKGAPAPAAKAASGGANAGHKL